MLRSDLALGDLLLLHSASPPSLDLLPLRVERGRAGGSSVHTSPALRSSRCHANVIHWQGLRLLSVLEIKKIALLNERVEEPPVFDKSISGDLLFEMLSLFIGVEKMAYLLL